ncbi:MAG: TIGR03086 family protein [Pseudonocardiaceae bacterium]|nr:TIGR03086 family protein [Pseudonocardiaceae bacterium]
MTEPEVFLLADEALVDVVNQIRDEQWSSELPPGFLMMQRDRIPTLREVVHYHAYDDAWVPDMLVGRTMDEAGRDKFDGDLLGADPKASFAAIAQQACAAARNLDDLDRVVHCSFGDFPAREYFWQINGFRGLRAHDLARVIGIEPKLPDELVQGMWDEISPNTEEWRAIGVFPAAVPVAEDAPLLHRLLGLTGRDPAWRP